ncbi:MAG TPA: hypothetical protein ENN60_03050 [archaeon]|nr:hypothetical protein [archaeon]
MANLLYEKWNTKNSDLGSYSPKNVNRTLKNCQRYRVHTHNCFYEETEEWLDEVLPFSEIAGREISERIEKGSKKSFMKFFKQFTPQLVFDKNHKEAPDFGCLSLNASWTADYVARSGEA